MVKDLFIFTAGVTTGCLVTWAVLKDAYERRTQEEVNSVIERFEQKTQREPVVKKVEETNSEAKEKALAAREKPDIMQYAAKLQSEGYVNYSEISQKEEPVKLDKVEEPQVDDEEEDIVGRPYVIKPYEFGEIEEYEQISLNYFADEVLTDEDNEIIDNVDEIVGVESLTHFGEYEDDSVFVRNERLRTDYEILLDRRNYSDVMRRTGRRVED